MHHSIFRSQSTSILIRTLSCALALGIGACSSTNDGRSGSGGSGSGGSSNGSGGTTASGGQTGSGGSGSGGASNGSGGSGSGGSSNGSGGMMASGGKTGSGGSGSGGSGAGTGGGSPGSGGAASGGTTGTGGSGTGGGSSGSGGASGGGATGTASGGASGGGATGTASGGASGGGATGTAGCPSPAMFCSGFEDAAQPPGTTYKVNAAPGDWTRDFAIDTMVKHSGNSSLRVKSGADSGTSGSQYRMLAVPVTGTAFWARFWIRSDMDLGGEHNPFAMASPDDSPDKNNSVEFAEDVGIAFNTNDDVRWPDGYGRLMNGSTKPYVLPKDTWHCIELSFDSAQRVQQLYVAGKQLINATNYPSMALTEKTFKFGFWTIHGPDRHMWYDDLAVAATRIGGCS